MTNQQTPDNNKPAVTAVGRLLKSDNGTPRVYKVIAVQPDGTVKTLIDEPLQD